MPLEVIHNATKNQCANNVDMTNQQHLICEQHENMQDTRFCEYLDIPGIYGIIVHNLDTCIWDTQYTGTCTAMLQRAKGTKIWSK